MRSWFFIILFSLHPQPLFAQSWTGITKCGTYQIKGVIRSVNGTPTVVVKEKSKSEFSIHPPISNEPMLAPYVDKYIDLEMRFDKKFPNGNMQALIQKIDQRMPNPLDPNDEKIRLIKESKCNDQ
jgi:hypothetical protein